MMVFSNPGSRYSESGHRSVAGSGTVPDTPASGRGKLLTIAVPVLTVALLVVTRPLSLVVGDVPDRNYRDTQFGVRPGVRPGIATFERIVRRERGVGVVEKVLEIFDQLGF